MAKLCLQRGWEGVFVQSRGEEVEREEREDGLNQDLEQKDMKRNPMHLEAQGLVIEALHAKEATGAWKAIRRAARMPRATRLEIIGTVACEMIERWGWIWIHARDGGELAELCEQEDVDGGRHR